MWEKRGKNPWLIPDDLLGMLVNQMGIFEAHGQVDLECGRRLEQEIYVS